MSRIGKQPIAVPSGVEVKLDATGRNIDIKGAKGNLTFHWRPEIEVTHCDDDKQIVKTAHFGARQELELTTWSKVLPKAMRRN